MSVTTRNIYSALNIIRRVLHSCPVMCKDINKQAIVLGKLLTGSHRKQKNWSNAEKLAASPLLPSSKKFQQGSQSKRRVEVLNKLFMSSITDLLASGEVAPSLVGHGICITRVKVASDFSAVNVYWTAELVEHDADMDKILENAGFEIRHNLCQLHIMGKVPRIFFIADRWQMALENTLKSLEEARLKDGYVEVDIAEEMKSECVLDVSIEPEILAKIDEIKEFAADPLPPMTHNVLGLDHASIMIKIERAVQKSEARHRKNVLDDSEPYIEPSVAETSMKEIDIHLSDIRLYITKQKIQKKKALKALQNDILADMAKEEEKTKEEEYIDMEDEDFIEEFQDVMRNGIKLGDK